MGFRVELFEAIRRDHRREELSIRELATRHGVHRRTVRQARESILSADPQRRSSAPILGIAQLQALDRGRAVLLTSGNPAALIATVPWMAGPDADNIRASVAYWAPHGEKVAATGWGAA